MTYKKKISCIGITIIKIRGSQDRLIIIMDENNVDLKVRWLMNMSFSFLIILKRGRHLCTKSCWDSLQWRHNERGGISNHQPHDCLLNHLFRGRRKKTSKLSVTGLCEGNSPVTSEFPAQKASDAENVSIWWSHHVSAKFQIATW